MIFLPRPSSEHPACLVLLVIFFSLKYFQRLSCNTALCLRFPPLKMNFPTWPAWVSFTPWRAQDCAGPPERTFSSTVKTRMATLNCSWLSTTSRLVERTSYHWRRASRSVRGLDLELKIITKKYQHNESHLAASGSLWSNNHYKAWFLNVILLRVLHREWSRKVMVIYHNSDLDDYFGPPGKKKTVLTFIKIIKASLGPCIELWNIWYFWAHDWWLVVTEAKLFPIKCRVPRAGFCQQCHITIV